MFASLTGALAPLPVRIQNLLPRLRRCHCSPEPAHRHLEALLKTLRDIEGTVIVATGALREDDSFVGVNVARVLRTQVSNRLSLEVDRATELFAIELKTDKEYES